MNKEAPVSFAGKIGKEFVGTVIGKGLEISLNIQANRREQLESLAGHLQNGSIILPTNHISVIDPEVLWTEVFNSFGSSVKKFIIPTSQKFFDGRMGYAASATMEYTLRKHPNLELLPMVQHTDKSKQYGWKDRARINKGTIDRMVEALHCPGTVVAFFPEGTRSKIGAMTQAQPGVVNRLAQGSPDSIIIPAGIHGTEQVMGRNYEYNPLKKAYIDYANPIYAGEMLDRSKYEGIPPQDLLMLDIAAELPWQYHGYYNYHRFPWYFKNRIDKIIPQYALETYSPKLQKRTDPFEFKPDI